MKNIFKIILMIFIVLFQSIPTYATSSGIRTIRIFTPSWPGQTNADGTGLFFDIVRSIYEPAGIKMTYKIVPWKRAEKMLMTNQADAMVDVLKSNAYITPVYPMNVLQQYVVFRKDNIKKWKGIETLENKSLVWIFGYDFHKNHHLKSKKFKWTEAKTHASAWQMVVKGRTDFYLDVLADFENYIKNNNIDMEHYGIENVWNENTYMSFANSEKSKKLIEIYDKRIITLFQSGELKKIFEKWNYKFSPDAWKSKMFKTKN
ncbi:transporter substrate-binding domain-containing protein [Desulfobacterales bacterium HSG17]|nr:transporter substrate-binding domain-containing protein [Desulfobacterales bacterium HSG17]